jgi:hypothetical protein
VRVVDAKAGGKDLKSSQSYPVKFGLEIAFHLSKLVKLLGPDVMPAEIDLSDSGSDNGELDDVLYGTAAWR